MCGRFDCHTPVGDIIKTFGAVQSEIPYEPNYNVAPTHRILIINNEGKKRLLLCRWGFMPSQEKDLSFGNRLINARAETVATLPTFRAAFMKQRCLVIADGFYEWRREGTKKVPVYVRLKSGRPFGLAGLYNTWVADADEAVCTCTIITTEANELLSEVHDRMPVIVPRDKEDFWIDPDNGDLKGLQALLTPYPSEEMECYQVSTKVNSAACNSPENIRPIEATG
jgi:putative SOS response-associated peptidase YedK